MLNPILTKSDIESAVYLTVRQILDQKSSSTETIAGSDKLYADLGFTSLDLAQLIASLEIELDIDPFSEQIAITSIKTVNDLCQSYFQCYFGDTTVTDKTSNSDFGHEVNRGSARQIAMEKRRSQAATRIGKD